MKVSRLGRLWDARQTLGEKDAQAHPFGLG